MTASFGDAIVVVGNVVVGDVGVGDASVCDARAIAPNT
jgi:hypothetical protein